MGRQHAILAALFLAVLAYAITGEAAIRDVAQVGAAAMLAWRQLWSQTRRPVRARCPAC